MIDFSRILFLTEAQLTSGILRHGQAGFATDTLRYIIRDLTGAYRYFFALIPGSGTLDVVAKFGATGLEDSQIFDNGLIVRVGTAANNTSFDTTGHQTMAGDGRPWRDELGDVTKLKKQGTGIVEDVTESSVGFNTAANLNDYLYANVQLNHDKDLASTVHPHIHWWQTTANTPNWLLQYRWQINGAAKTVAWTSAIPAGSSYVWAAGTLNQITEWPAITPPVGAQLSDVLQYRVLRDNANASGLFAGADPVGATQYIMSFDSHFMLNSVGSDQEYVK